MKKAEHEMLVLAAKAAGIPIKPCTCSNPNYPFAHDEPVSGKYGHWNPLVRDGDALRLAGEIKTCIDIEADEVVVYYAVGKYVREVPAGEGTIHAAMRRAIVRAAAKIGEAMP